MGDEENGVTSILLVEDDDSVRQLIGEMLRRRGYQVLEAGGGAEAAKLAEQAPQPIDVLLTDVVMPRMSGSELAGVVSAMRPGIRVLYISGYSEDELREYGITRRQPNFLQKPFTQEELIHKLESLLHEEPRTFRAAGSGSNGL
jgi:CheY-like chemotaxis protein